MPDIINKAIYKAKVDKPSFDSFTRLLEKIKKEQDGVYKDAISLVQTFRKELLKQVDIYDDVTKSSEGLLKQDRERTKEIEKQTATIQKQKNSFVNVGATAQLVKGGVQGLSGTGIAGLENIDRLADVATVIDKVANNSDVATLELTDLANSIGVGGVGLVGAAAGAVIGLKIIETQLKGIVGIGKELILASNQSQLDIATDITSGKTFDELTKQRRELLLAAQDTSNALAEVESDFDKLRDNPVEAVVAGLTGVVGGLQGQQEKYNATLAQQLTDIDAIDRALQNQSTTSNDTTQSILDNTTALRENFDLEQRVTAFANTATKQQLDDRLEYLDLERQLILQQQNELLPVISENSTKSEEARLVFETLQGQLDALNTETNLLNGNLGDLIITRQAETDAIEAQKEAEKVNRQRTATLKRLVSLEQQANRAIDDFTRKLSELVSDRQRRDLRELEDFQIKQSQAFDKHQDDLAKIQRDGNKRIVSLQNSVKGLQADFFADGIEAQRQYTRDLEKINANYRLEDKQALDDHLAGLRDAEQNNDVLAFINEQRNFQAEQRKKEETRNLNFKQLNDQFQEESRIRRIAFNEKQDDLRREIQLERQQTDEKLADAQRGFELEQQLAEQERQLKLQRQAEDDRLQDQRSRQALQRSLNDINRKAQAEINAIRSVTSAVSQLQQVANRISTIASTRSASSSFTSNLASLINPPSFQNADAFGAFARGGIVDRPTLAMVGEGQNPEAIIPFNKSRGLQSALSDFGILPRGLGNGGIKVDLMFAPNLSVGDIATASQVTDALQQFSNSYTRELESVFSRAVNGNQ